MFNLFTQLNDLNSYNSGGDDLGDFTSVYIQGGKKGDSTLIDVIDTVSGAQPMSTFDNNPQTAAYIPFSPKDLTVDGLDIKIYNTAAHPNGSPSVGASIGEVGFVIKGYLM